MSQETITLAKYAAALSYEDIPVPVLQRVRDTICDTIGAIAYGYELPWSKMICDYALSYSQSGRSHILAPGLHPVSAPMAALANGAMAHAFELDGAVKPSVGVHPCATIFPASLAIAQEHGANGMAFLTAFVAAAEVMLRIGSATMHSNETRGFHAPGTTGPFGATIASGRLLGLDSSKLTHALGIAASLPCGLVQFSRSGTGGMVKRMHFGRANESGVMAAELAKRGFDGPIDAVEGEFGFLRVYCNECDMTQLTKGLGEKYLTMNIYMKRYACHGSAQAPLQALQYIQAETPIKPDDVEAIDVYGNHEMVDRHNILEPKDPMLAQYSVPFSVALAFFRDPRDPRSFDQSAVEDPAIKALSSRVKLRTATDAGHLSQGSSISIKLKNGLAYEKSVEHFIGAPALPPNRDTVYEKYSLLTKHLPRQKMDEIFNRVQELEKETDFNWLKL